MSEQSVVIIGLPESGKTTYLAALWHVVTARDVPTKLRFGNLLAGTAKHLNEIAARWRNAEKQERTLMLGSRVVSMNLKSADDSVVKVTFPDVPGEEYRRMWEDRDANPDVIAILRAGGVLLFMNADDIHGPNWIADENAMYAKWGLAPIAPGEPVPWHPRAAPTQVQLVDMLQLLRSPPIDIGPRKLAIMLSVWDKVSEEGRTPAAFLAEKMPLLDQYLRHNADAWTYVTYGISAQGGDYDDVDPEKEKTLEAEALRQYDKASTRVDVVMGDVHSHDLTEPLAWLME